MFRSKAVARTTLMGVLVVLLATAVACAGGTPAPNAATPQQPAPAAQPAPAEPAAEPAKPAQQPSTTLNLPRIAPAPETNMMEGPRYGGILRVGHRNDPPAAWDTMRSTNYNNTLIAPSIWGDGNLAQACRDEELSACPALAESWEVNDSFTVWTFKARDDVLWHDGVPFSAEDIAFWTDLFFNGVTVGDTTRQAGTNKARFGELQSVEVLDGNRVRYTLGENDPLFLERVSLYRIPIQHAKHLAEPQIKAGNVDVSPVDMGYVGTGPFKFHAYEKGVAVEVRRFDQYWDADEKGNQLPYLDGVDYLIIKEPAAFHAAFRSGRLDAGVRARGFYVPPEMVPSYRKSLDDSFWLAELFGGESPGLGFNTTKPPFDDIRVRHAISLWTDRQSAIDTFGGGYGHVVGLMSDAYWSNPKFETWPGYNPATKEADRAEAKRLMAEAGYPDGLSFTLLSPRTFSRLAEWWQGSLAGLANVELELLDVAAHDQKVSESNYTVVQGSGGAATPQDLITSWGTKDVSPYAKVVHYDPKIAGFLTELNQQSTLGGKRDVVRRMEKYVLLDQAMTIRTFIGVDLVPHRDYVKGMYVPVSLSPPTYASYSTVWLDK